MAQTRFTESITPILKGKKVTVFFNDGSESIHGEVLAYSRYEILLMGPEGHLLIFKQSIRSIKPEKPIKLKELFDPQAEAQPVK
jgi:sRNA-binding regulator protein Hfq